VALYIAAYSATLKPATLSRRLASISTAHRAVGFDNTASLRHGGVADVLRGIRRTKGTKQDGKSALVADHLRSLIAGLPESVIGNRDAALLLLGFSGAFRRSELVALNVEDLEFGEKGLRVTLRFSKTDQEGQGRYVGIPYSANHRVCPVRRLQRWLKDAGIATGPVFRPINRHGHVSPHRLSGQGVWIVVKRACATAGLEAGEFGAHSLRSGFVTTALNAGKSETAIIGQTGHKSTVMLRRYHKETDLFKNNPSEGLL
jgi:integrase